MGKRLLAVVLALSMVLLSASAAWAQGEDFLAGVHWSGEYDVVVAGFGIAGATAALTAAEQGARVLLVEKAPREGAGGNSAVCMQYICYTQDKDAATAYMKALRNDYSTPSDAVIDAYVDEVSKNMEWAVAQGATDPTILEGHPEYPEMEGATSLPYFTVDGTPGGNGAAYRLIRANVEKNEAIDVWYEAPATQLIQDPATGIIHGLAVQVDGQTLNIRAKNGVVLCTGGFEANDEMLENYCMEKNAYSLGHAIYNTGDGIKMAQAVGADLWHMAHYVSHIDFVDEETLYAPFRLAPKVANMGAIFVGGDGTRFMDETYTYRHGKYYYHGSFITIPHPETMWMIFDETVMAKGPLFPSFSQDNAEEIAKGWITAGDSLADLAEKIGLDAQALANTVSQYNALCQSGEDIFFGRSANYLFPLSESGKFYAMPLFQSLVNTMGGPVRDENGQILDTQGNPIPHLYAAGELGDIWSFGYQAGCNFGGGMAFGRISGRNAAAPKADASQDSVMGGRDNYLPESAASIENTIICEANQFLGQGTGKGLTPLYVRLTMEGGRIANVEVVHHSETPGIADPALERIPHAIVAAGSADVDSVSGATLTSDGIKEAVADALSKVGETAIDEREAIA